MLSFIRYTYFVLTLILSGICFFADHDLISYPSFQVIALTGPYLFLISFLSALFYAIKTRFDVTAWFGICIFFTWEAVIALFGLDFSESFIKNPEYEIKVLSLNAAQLSYVNDNIETLADEILKYNPDVICFQEIGIKENWQNKDEIGYKMAAALKMPYYSFSRHENNIYGLAVFSKLKVNSSTELFLPISHMNGGLKYELTTPKKKKLTLYNFHLSSFNLKNDEDKSIDHLIKIIGEQQEQAEIIRENFEVKNAVIMVGDLNSPPYLHTYKTLSKDLKDSFDFLHLGYGSTIANPLLPFRIDVQFHNEYIKCVKFKNISTPFSDHNIQLGTYEIY